MSAAEFFATKYPPRQRVVGPLLERSLTYMFGPPGANKTWLALTMMKAANAAGHVSYAILEEGDPGAIQARFKALDLDGFFIAPRNGLKLNVAEDLAWIVSEVAATKAKLVILDPLSDLTDSDENDQKEMRQLRTYLRHIVDETGAAVVVLHHSNKASEGKKGEGWGSSFGNMRGSTILAGAADLMLEVRPVKKTEAQTEAGEWSADIFMPKARDIRGEPPGRLTMRDLGDGKMKAIWLHGEEARVEAIEKATARRTRDHNEEREAETFVLRTLEREATSSRSLEALAGSHQMGRGFPAKVKRAVARLTEERRIRKVTANGKPAWALI